MAKARNRTLKADVTADIGIAEIKEPMPMEEAIKETTVAAKPMVRAKEAPSSPTTPQAAETKGPAQAVAVVPIEVFRQVSGVKPDQFAGFAWYAKRHGLKPQSVASWRKEYEQFLSRAVG